MEFWHDFTNSLISITNPYVSVDTLDSEIDIIHCVASLLATKVLVARM
jgi:hypothetical protein